MKFLLEFHPIRLWKNSDANLDILIPEPRLLPQSGGNRRRKRGRWGSISYFTGARFVCWCIFHSLGIVLGNLRNIKWMPTGVLIWGDNLLKKKTDIFKNHCGQLLLKRYTRANKPFEMWLWHLIKRQSFPLHWTPGLFCELLWSTGSGRHDIMWPLGLIL